ncbi:MAG: DUF6473 family protein [Paracoccaceae bacterium]
MSFDTMGPGGLDYLPCRYGASKLRFRGPKRDLDKPFVAFFGGTNTYGKFVERPFADLIEDELDIACVNFGCLNAGVDVLAQDAFMCEIRNQSKISVVQIVSPRNMSNRFYSVHPRRNDRFLKPSALLETVYREVDFSQFNFTKHMLKRLHEVSPERFRAVKEELQSAWSARMLQMLDEMSGQTVLLWFSDHQPQDNETDFGKDPWFVSRQMLDEVTSKVAAYVEVIASPKAVNLGTSEMVFSEMEEPAAQTLLGPAAHREVSEKLAPVLQGLLK